MSEENKNNPSEETTENRELQNAEPKKVETAKEKSGADYVKEAFDCFLKGKPKDTEPLSVIRDFYEKNASPELKEKCKAEGKTVEGAYGFMCQVSRKAVGKSISDSIGLSICMHYFQDVPALADFEPELEKAEKAKREAERRKEIAAQVAKDKIEKKTKAKEKAKATKAAKKAGKKPEKQSATAKCPCETCETCAADGTCQNKESPTTYGHTNPSLVHCPYAKTKAENSKIDEDLLDLMVEYLAKSNTREDFKKAISHLTAKQKCEYYNLLLAEFFYGELEGVTEKAEARQQFEFKNKITYKAADGGERVQYPSIEKIEEAEKKAAAAIAAKEGTPEEPEKKPEPVKKPTQEERERSAGQGFLF